MVEGREIAVRSHPEEDATPMPREVEQMAVALEGRHGVLAEDVADFFADFNGRRGDAMRAWAWTVVGDHIRRRSSARRNAG
jgi:hypothetical protein